MFYEIFMFGIFASVGLLTYENYTFFKKFPGGFTGNTLIKMEDNTFKKVKHLKVGDSIAGDSAFPDNNVIIAIVKFTDRKFPVYVFDSVTGISPCLFHDKLLNHITYVDELYCIEILSKKQIETKYNQVRYSKFKNS